MSDPLAQIYSAMDHIGGKIQSIMPRMQLLSPEQQQMAQVYFSKYLMPQQQPKVLQQDIPLPPMPKRKRKPAKP